MSITAERVYVARLVGTTVFDPIGETVGRVRDVVMLMRTSPAPTAVGLVVEVPGRRRVFLPITRVTSISPGHVICTGVVNVRRFQSRANETLAMAELLERHVKLKDGSGEAMIEDIAIELTRGRTWSATRLYVRRVERRKGPLGLLRRGEALVVDVDQVTGLIRRTAAQGTALVIQSFEGQKPADVAAALREMPEGRRMEIALALDDVRLADVIEELPEDEQVALINALDPKRAAAVVKEMEPDDAADLLGDLSDDDAKELLELMEPEDARGVRQLMSYDDNSAGGLMTTEPVIVGPETTVATALALVRKDSLTPALASMVFVVRPPLETPTGRYLGLVHTQRLLREAPHDSIGGFVDPAIEPQADTDSLIEVSRRMAAYDTLATPVVDKDGHFLGAISIDDVLDHLLPDDWRENAGGDLEGGSDG